MDGRSVPFVIRFDVPGIPVALSARPRAIGRARWMPDGKGIAFVGLGEQRQAVLFVQDFVPGRDTLASRRALVPAVDDESASESFAIAPDGTSAVVSVVEQSPSLMIPIGLAGVVPPFRAKR